MVVVVVAVAPAVAVVFLCLFLMNMLIGKGSRGVHDAAVREKQNKIYELSLTLPPPAWGTPRPGGGPAGTARAVSAFTL